MHEISIIMAMRNSEKWLTYCLSSIECQTFNGSIELSVYDDGSNDNTIDMFDQWVRNTQLKHKQIHVIISYNTDENHLPKGVGFAKNRAVEQSDGHYLCFLDSDDVMLETRIEKQYLAAKRNPNAIIGCQFIREPSDSTKRYTEWANHLSPQQLYNQIYTSNGPTLLMPTWFCCRDLFNKVGGFDERGTGVPEDLIFFFKHLRLGGNLIRIDEPLLIYRYHIEQTTFSVSEEAIWAVRLEEFEKTVLSKWETFTIWNAGKHGRKLYRSLSQHIRNKVIAFCDVDSKKINRGWYTWEESGIKPKPKVPIIHFSKITPPVVICVKLGLTLGNFEHNLSLMNLSEGKDYFHFG